MPENQKKLHKYYEILRNLKEHEIEEDEILGFIRYHQQFPLDEKFLKQNGILHAIQKFYSQDKIEFERKLKKNPGDVYILERIKADELCIESREQCFPLEYLLVQKEFLEKELTEEEKEQVREEINREVTRLK